MEKKRVRHLGNAPIVEAVLDIRVSGRPEKKIDEFKALELIEYPDREVAHSLQFSSVFDTEKLSTIEHNFQDDIIGYRYKSASKNRLVQFRLNGFTFNQLPEYPSWEELLEESWRLWQLYIELADPINVTRIALRYINRTVFPERKPGEYIEQPPAYNEAVAGFPLTKFFFHSQLKISEDIEAGVIQMTEAEGANPGLPYVLDIDIARTGNFVPQDPKLKIYFEELRDLKNNIFFNTVTNKALDLWK